MSKIDTVFDLNQIAGPDLALNCITPFADFLPSFWAKGILRALDYLFSSARFSFPALVRSLAPAVDGSLIFINIWVSARRYGEIMARRGGKRSSSAGQANERNRNGL
ncbi:MAG TPA: hypothetical protein VMV87_18045 [Burkholderiales bacterium]|nr:hypothetical protein [Burkholderiales bacterium]